MKKLISTICMLVLCWVLKASADSVSVETQRSKPNVLFINVDDLGWRDLGYMGGDFFETPNIDALSKEGMFFTRSYSGAANCAPSRACLMTGLNTPRHGVYTVSPSARGRSSTRKLIPVTNTDSLSHRALTLAELFKKASYRTGTFGKWHLGHDPLDQGFDHNVGGNIRGNPGKDGYFSPYNLANIENGPQGELLTDRLTDEAITFMEQREQTPFFAYLAYYAVHTPLMARPALIDKYRKKANPLDIDPVYAAMVETVDDNIGKLMDFLRVSGLERNTLVVFTSDNGGIRSIATQAPLRAGKGSYYEGGIRVPCIVKWPGVVKPGSRYDRPISNLDFFPTFQSILNVYVAEGKTIFDGSSILPVLKGGALKERPLFFHFPIYLQKYNAEKDDARDPLFRTRPGSVVIYGQWKLHHYYEDDGFELYNLKKDVGERKNMAVLRPRKTSELNGLLKKWLMDVQAPIPVALNPEYEGKR